MKYMNIALIVTGVLQVSITSIGLAQHHGVQSPKKNVDFRPVHSEHEATIRVEGTPDEVFSLFEPSGLQLWNGLWKMTEPVFVQTGKSLAGSVYRRRIEGHDEPLEETRVVADHDPATGRVRYIHFIPGVEAWEYEYTVKPHSDGGTAVTVSLIMTSLSEKANEWVLETGKHFNKSVKHYVPALNKLLQKKQTEGTAYTDHSPKQTAFKPIAIEREYRIHLNCSPAEAFSLFEQD